MLLFINSHVTLTTLSCIISKG